MSPFPSTPVLQDFATTVAVSVTPVEALSSLRCTYPLRKSETTYHMLNLNEVMFRRLMSNSQGQCTLFLLPNNTHTPTPHPPHKSRTTWNESGTRQSHWSGDYLGGLGEKVTVFRWVSFASRDSGEPTSESWFPSGRASWSSLRAPCVFIFCLTRVVYVGQLFSWSRGQRLLRLRPPSFPFKLYGTNKMGRISPGEGWLDTSRPGSLEQ